MGELGLVLSGGGPVGIAWEAGVLAGLAEAGGGLTPARVVGTSAGAVVGAHLALGVAPARVLERYRADAAPDAARPAAEDAAPEPDGEPAAAPEIPEELLAAFRGDAGDATEVRRRIGAFAVRADTGDEEAFVASFGRRLAAADWPPGFVATAVDVASGDFAAFDTDAGVPLARAVAASCAVPGIFPPITIGGRRYMDGGVRSVSNADLATGCDVVVVLSVLASADGRDAPDADPLSARLAAEVAELEEAGARVLVCAPDETARAAIGLNPMDTRQAGAAGDAGLAQGRREASRLAAVVDAAGS